MVHGLYSNGVEGGPVLPEDGEAYARKIGAFKYVERSLNDPTQVKAVFTEVKWLCLITSIPKAPT